MRCETCRGTGRAIYQLRSGHFVGVAGEPCRDCNGSGVVHCCEGERCSPDDPSSFEARQEARTSG
jgi:DnaJ-class molecular chaperone